MQIEDKLNNHALPLISPDGPIEYNISASSRHVCKTRFDWFIGIFVRQDLIGSQWPQETPQYYCNCVEKGCLTYCVKVLNVQQVYENKGTVPDNKQLFSEKIG